MIDPKELIENLSVEDLCRTADAYFKSIQDPTPQMGKPFSSLIEAPEMLQNMGHMLSGLRLGKTMTVLEFAAGTCWFSRFLNQLQCITISCDVSEAALGIGKRLFSEFPIVGDLIAAPAFLHFDGHRIELPSDSVDRIVCHDGFHHVPNQDEVISELARVLKSGGIAAFSEPGRFHSRSPQSQYEMRNYKVLENDIVLSEIFAIANRHGFTDISVKLLSDMEVTLSDYRLLASDALLKLPRFGATTSTLESGILNNVRNAMINRTIFFLHKGKFVADSRSHTGLSHSVSVAEASFSVRAEEELCIPLRVTNNGTSRWLHENISIIGTVNIGTHLYDESNNLLNLDFSRHALKRSVEPGESFAEEIKIRFADQGRFVIAVDLVAEGICWFENIGSKPVSFRVEVN